MRLIRYRELFLLLVFSIIACFFSIENTQKLFFILFLLILVSISTEYLLTNFIKTGIEFNIQNITTAFYIFLISDVNSNIFMSVFAVIVSVLCIHLIKHKGLPVFNSTALSLLLFSFLGLKISWWGISINNFILLFLLISGISLNFFDKTLRSLGYYYFFIFTFGLLFSFNIFLSLKQLLIPGFVFFAMFLFRKSILRYQNNQGMSHKR